MWIIKSLINWNQVHSTWFFFEINIHKQHAIYFLLKKVYFFLLNDPNYLHFFAELLNNLFIKKTQLIK